MWQPTIHGDSISDIYNSFQTPKIYEPFSATLPGFLCIALFTVIHVLLNYISLPAARKFARKETNLSIPSVMQGHIKGEKEIIIDGTKQCGYIAKPQLKEIEALLKNDKNINSNEQSEIKKYKKQHKEYEKHISKFQESLFKVIVFGFVYAYGVYVMFSEDFYWDAPLMWSRGVPQPLNDSLRFYYAIQLGYHGHRAVYQFFEYARPDFWAMFIHHWVASILIAGSWMLGYVQIGCVLLMSNDNTDLIMPAAKLFGYLGYKTMYNALGALFLILWFPLRIFLYPYKVLYSVLRADGGYYYIKTNVYAWICVFLLFIIYALQFYWSKLVVQTIYDTFFHGKIVDGRSDTEGNEIKKAKKEGKKHQ